MPDIGQRKKIDLSSTKGKTGTKSTGSEESKAKKPATPTPAKRPQPKPPKSLIDEDDEDDFLDGDTDGEDDDDEIIAGAINGKKEGKGLDIKLIAGAVGVIILVIVLFVVFLGNRGKNEEPVDTGDIPPTQEEPSAGPAEPDYGDAGLGTQDFSGDTNNTSDSPLTDPEDYTKDIYGLTVRVNYDVAKIQEAADFVNYTKHRGTWGGGLELYYLDAEYRGNKYVVQVPFKYYKELDETGIVPVKMEVLRIKSETSDDYLTVVSYMQLDEETLKQVLKSQSK